MAKTSKTTKSSQSQKTVVALVAALVLLIGGSFAWLTLTLNGTKTSVITAGTLALTLNDANGIAISSGVPMTDADGLATTAYTFSLENTGTISSDYTIYLDDTALTAGETRMADGFIKYSLTKNDGTPVTALLNTTGTNPQRVLTTGNIAANATDTYTLRLWIDSAATNDVMGTVFKGQIRVEASQVK